MKKATHVNTINEPTRQVHLDFHTSEHIPEVGKNFSKGQFKKALELGNINQVNVFAKCHHSWCYYPTKVKYSKMHPNLEFDLLGQQLEVCHQLGIKAPIYLTVGWSAYDAEMHPEWCMRDSKGDIIEWNQKTGNEVEEISSIAIHAEREIKFKEQNFRPYCNWKFLCPSGRYKKMISSLVSELCRNYNVDGFFFDIHFTQLKCYCSNCKQSMAKHNYDIDNPKEVNQHWNEVVLGNFTKDMKEQIQSLHPDASIFYNGLTTLEVKENHTFRLHENGTKNDLEDMPSSWGGYDKLAKQARYFHNYPDKPIVAMSGKFHTTWGEFGGFKYPYALKYEAASMISHGARCNFGDHLHPSGEMDINTYQNIGFAFEYIKKIEEFGIGGKPFSNIALYLTGSFEADDGVTKMLHEEHIEYEVVSSNTRQETINRFDLIIVPSSNVLNVGEIAKLKKFENKNRKLVFIGQGALTTNEDGFVFDIGAKYLGKSDYDMDYIQARTALSKDLVSSPFISYYPALKSQPHNGAKILADLKAPYFSRTLDKYNGHLYAPNKLYKENYPAVIEYNNILFFAHDIDRIYAEYGSRVHRQLFGNAIRLFLSNLMIQTKGLPSSGRISFLHQKEKQRFILHLLYAPPLKRGRCMVIEDIPDIYDIEVSLHLDIKIKSAKIINLKKTINFNDKEKISFKIDKLSMHEMVVLEY